MGKITCSLEEWDSILNFYRPNGSSKSWYIKELKRISRPLMWGNWDIFSEDGEMFSADFFKGKICPTTYSDKIEYVPIDKIGNKKHIYIINIYNMSFFNDNYDIGFKCISKKYLDDVREGRSKIVLFLTYEGYSGSKDNNDFEIIDKWRIESNLPPFSVYYACGNLLGKEIALNKNLKINVEPILDFEAWNKFNDNDIVDFKSIDEKNLFLIYNRNPRPHRVKFIIELLKNNLFNRGLLSLGRLNLYNPEIYLIPNENMDHFNYLKDNSPFHINSAPELYYNLACNITKEDYERTFISVISETLMDEETLFISEKTWKPLMTGHPFLILGNKGTLKYLKSLGYKTFNRWFNEDYDNEDNETIRINNIINILIDFSKKSNDELILIRNEMRDICEHNQKTFNRLYGMKYGENNINKQISTLIETVWYDINYKTFNLVYDQWDNNKPIPNGSIYYEHKNAFSDGISLLNHSIIHSKRENLKIKQFNLTQINESENFFYIINHHINPTFLTKENEDFVITNEIIEKLKQYKNFKLLLITEHEPIDEDVFVLINDYFSKKNVNLSQIYCINNNSKLEEYKKKYNSDINVYKINFLLFCKIRDMRDGGGCEFTTDKQGKFFMTFNKSIKPHRTALLCLLMKYNLIDYVNWSFIPNSNETIHLDFMKDVIHEDKELENLFKYLLEVNYKLSDYENNMFTYNKDDNNEKRNLSQKLTEIEIVDTYINSYVNITTESVFNRLPNTVHISEKSFKPFFYYQFPIFVASQGHVKQMKEEYGLDFFDDIIDHSYDDEFDHKKRLTMIIEEIKRLSTVKNELIDFYKSNRDRFENNKKIIINLLEYIQKDYLFFENLT
jgi:hypothetical protein